MTRTDSEPNEDTPLVCERCHQPILLMESRESYSATIDGRFLHSACVGALCLEVLGLMLRLGVRLQVQFPDSSSGIGHEEPLPPDPVTGGQCQPDELIPF